MTADDKNPLAVTAPGFRAGGLFSWRTAVILVPFVWLGLFFLAPFAVVLKISFAEATLSQPPFTPLIVEDAAGRVQLDLHASNYALTVQDGLYAKALGNAVLTAAGATLLSLLIGYPIALAMAAAAPAWRLPLVLLVILPFWTSFLLRVYAWIGILKEQGWVNNLLLSLGIIDAPVRLLHTPLAVQLGIVYAYLPFMVLPLYAILVKQDRSLLEAAADLGAPPWRRFLSVTLPLSVPGIAAGGLLVFIPAVGEFVIPDLLGGPDTLMIGKVLWTKFFTNRDWPFAAALTVVMLLVLVAPLMMLQTILGAREQSRV